MTHYTLYDSIAQVQVMAYAETWSLGDTDRDALLAVLASHRELLDAFTTILKGFDAGVFCRNADGDHEPGWAMKCLPYIKALAVGQQAIAKAEGQ